MWQHHKKRVFTISVLLLSALFMSVCCLLILTEYNELVYWIVKTLQKPAIESLIRNKALTPQKYTWLQYLSAAGLLFIPVLAGLLLKRADKISAGIGITGSSITHGFRGILKVFYQNSKAQNISILLTISVILIKCLYYINTWDLQYDEMWCYNYLTARPLMLSF